MSALYRSPTTANPLHLYQHTMHLFNIYKSSSSSAHAETLATMSSRRMLSSQHCTSHRLLTIAAGRTSCSATPLQQRERKPTNNVGRKEAATRLALTRRSRKARCIAVRIYGRTDTCGQSSHDADALSNRRFNAR